jgi:hypothetical protein
VFVAYPELLPTAIDQLVRLLEEESPRVVKAALTALKGLATPLDFFGFRQLMQVFRLGLVNCDDLLVAHAVEALRAVCESPKKEAATFFHDDVELTSHALAALSSEIDEGTLPTVRLPTSASWPVPLPDWRPAEIRLPVDEHERESDGEVE